MKKVMRQTGITFLMLFGMAWARINVAIFPLVNTSGDNLVQWAAYGITEAFPRAMQTVRNVCVWDPAFLFAADSAGWEFNSDSLLREHRRRWKWDAAVGGSFSIDSDTVRVVLSIVRFENDVPRYETVERADVSLRGLVDDAVVDIVTALKVDVSPRERAAMGRTVTTDEIAYRTYCAGYGHEIRREYSEAVSAYGYALELDPRLAVAAVRMGRLFAVKRDFDNARQSFAQAAKANLQDPRVVALSAGVMAEFESPSVAGTFIGTHAGLLEQTASGMTAIARVYMADGEYQRAIAMLTKAIAFGAGDLEADFVLGRAYMESGNYQGAARQFNRLIAFRPAHLRYYSFLGMAYRHAGRFMESVRVLETAHRLDRNNVPVILELSHTFFKLGWYERAEQLLLHAKECGGDCAAIDINLGVVYWHMGNRRKARELFAQAARSPGSAQAALNNEGNILFLNGEIKQALKKYRKAERIGRKDEMILYNLAGASLLAGRQSDAQTWFDEVLRLSPERLDVLLVQASFAVQRGDKENAEMYYRKALELSLADGKANRELVTLYAGQNRWEDALAVLDRYLAVFPIDREFRALRAETYRRMGWYEVAVQEYGFIQRDFPDYPGGSVGIAKTMYDLVAYGKKSNYDETIYALKNAIDLAPRDAELDFFIGTLYLEFKNDPEKAFEHWNRAYSKPGDVSLKKSIQAAIKKAKKQ